DQIHAYLSVFVLPEDFQERIKVLAAAIDADAGQQPTTDRRQLEARLARIKNLYEWGDKPEGEDLAERDQVTQQLRALDGGPARADDPEALENFADLLRNAALAWEVGDQAERNGLARALFEDVRVEGAEIVAVKPRPDFAPFFRLNYELWRE